MDTTRVSSLILRYPIVQSLVIYLSVVTTLSTSPQIYASIPGILIIGYVYIADRVEEPEEDKINESPGSNFIISNRYLNITKTLLLPLYVISGGILILSFNLSLIESSILVILLIFPLISFKLHNPLKQYILIDSINISLGWNSILVLLPIVLYSPDALTAAVVFLTWMILIIIGAEYINVNDIEGDKQSGKPTIATEIGEDKTRYLLKSLSAIVILSFYVTLDEYLSTLLALLYVLMVIILQQFESTSV